MRLILTILIIVVIFIIASMFLRRKVYHRVDAQVEKKVHLMNRRVAQELGKIRHLNLSGETESLFESWREEWDRINHEVFANLEDDLLGAEEAAEKYRFRKAFQILKGTEEKLNEVEETIDQIFTEVERLLHSERSSREEARKIEPRIKEVRQNVLQNGYQLGKAEVVFDVELDEIQESLDHYEQLSEDGNYSEAQELVYELHARLDELQRKVRVFPELFRSLKVTIPEELDQLQNGVRDMREDGFRIQHLGVEKEIHTLHESLITMIEALNNGNDDGVTIEMERINERIRELYDLLEKEAMDKQYVSQNIELINESVKQSQETFSKTKENVLAVKENYHLNEEKQDQQQFLEKTVENLEAAAEKINKMVEDDQVPFSEIRSEMDQWLNRFEVWKEPQEAFDHYLHNLRKDELDARDRIDHLRSEIIRVRQKLQKSNLPGVPNYLIELVESAIKLIDEGSEDVNKQPLDVEHVNSLLDKAEKMVNQAVEQTELLIEQAILAERVIQYANRYRSQYPLLAAQIAEAEANFLDYEYERALETAARALEEIEPGALKRIESVLESSVS